MKNPKRIAPSRNDRFAGAGPRWANWLLASFGHPDTLEEVQGDLLELYAYWVETVGERNARWRYSLSVLKLLRPLAKPKRSNEYQIIFFLSPTMLRNYLKIAWRNLAKNKAFTAINIGGLSFGMATCLLMLLFVGQERSFDQFHQRANRIVRLLETSRFEGSPEQTVAYTMLPMGPALKQDYPEVENFVRIHNLGKVTFRAGNRQLIAEQVLSADSSFLTVFDFPLLSGNRQTALQGPKGLLLTEEMAKKLFGRTTVEGQTIQLNTGNQFETYQVTGVLAHLPTNSHLQFDGIVPLHGRNVERWMEGWDSNWLSTYLVLRNKASINKLTSALPSFEQKYLKENNKSYDLHLQPLTDTHLDSEAVAYDTLNVRKFSRSYVNLFTVLAFFVLLIAILNFINLSTARTAKRAQEVGIRKTIGAGRWQLIVQFTGEAIVVCLLALILAQGMAILALPALSQLIDRPLSFDAWFHPNYFLLVLGSALLVGIIAGFYPALFLSAYQPLRVLKGIIKPIQPQRFSLRNLLVITQFSIAVSLIIGTILVTKQLQFLLNRSIGFTKEQVLIVPMNHTANKEYAIFKKQLLDNGHVLDITASSQRLGGTINGMGADYVALNGEKKHLSVSHLIVDYNYIPFYGISLSKGRNFSRQYGRDKRHAYIVNEALARDIQTNNPVGLAYKASWEDTLGTVIGLVKDFNFNSLHHKVVPLYISIQDWDYSELSIKIKPGQAKLAIPFIEQQWRKLVPDLPFTYTFLDDHLASLYQADQQVSVVVSIATGLAILIACLGLFGVVLFMVESRIKEIGVRKVLGASVSSIVALLSGSFLKLVLIAIMIASPVAWWVMSQWLEGFAYKIDIEWWVFAGSGLLVIGIALVTVSLQSVKAALMNPVKSLRSE